MSYLATTQNNPGWRSRWSKLIGGGVLAASLSVVAFQISAGEQQTTDEEKEDAIRKALDSLKKGPEPVKEEKPGDLNPVDAMRRAQEALEQARKQLKEDPKNEEARKVVEDATKKLQEGMKLRNPDLVMPNFPAAPMNFEDFDKDLQRVLDEYQKQLQQMQGNRMQMMQGLQGNRLMFLGRGNVGGEARLGIRIERPSVVLIEQLDLPPNVGMVVSDVIADTPAAKAGMKANDVLVEIAGKPVPSNTLELQRLIREFKADEKFDLVVLRKGKKETLKEVTLPPARPEGFNRPFAPMIPVPQIEIGNGNVRGTSMSIAMNGQEFTIKYTDDGVKYVVQGVKDDGGPKATLIEIDDNGKTHRTDTLEKLEGPQQEIVQKLLKQIR